MRQAEGGPDRERREGEREGEKERKKNHYSIAKVSLCQLTGAGNTGVLQLTPVIALNAHTLSTLRSDADTLSWTRHADSTAPVGWAHQIHVAGTGI